MVISEEKLRLLDNRCYDAMKRGHRPGTRRNKRSHGSIYSKFCSEHGLNEYPADEWQLARYACFTADHVTSIGTVKNYVGGVRSLQQLAGFPAPAPTSPNLKLVMSGIRAELAKPTKQASPLNRQILIEMATKVNRQSGYDMGCYSSILTGFFLCLRSSNLVPVSTPQFSSKEQLTRGDVAIDEDLEIGMFDVQWSKTVQYRQRDMWLAVSPASRSDICPLANLKCYFELVPATDEDPCFCYFNAKNELKALTYAQVSAKLKEWVKATGRDESTYTLHGMRRGSTTHCFDSGIDPDSIKLIGNWSSDAYFRYIDMDMKNRVKAAVTFSKKM